MPVTDEIFQAFLKCETKSLLKFSGSDETHSYPETHLNITVDTQMKQRYVVFAFHLPETAGHLYC